MQLHNSISKRISSSKIEINLESISEWRDKKMTIFFFLLDMSSHNTSHNTYDFRNCKLHRYLVSYLYLFVFHFVAKIFITKGN